jgi:hypothetical protein
MTEQSGELRRKPSRGERAWFLEKESGSRNKRIFFAGGNPLADDSVCLTAFVTGLTMLTKL